MTLTLALWTAVALGGSSATLAWDDEADSPLGGVKWAHLGPGSEVTVTQTRGEHRTVERRVLASVDGARVAFDLSTDEGTPVRQQQPPEGRHWELTDVLRVDEVIVAGHTYPLEVRELREGGSRTMKGGALTTVWALRRAGRLMVVKTQRAGFLERAPVQLDARLTIDGRDFRCQHWREAKGGATLEAWECPGLPVPARQLERSGSDETERVVTGVSLSGPGGNDGP
jgi:hypothetical protein